MNILSTLILIFVLGLSGLVDLKAQKTVRDDVYYYKKREPSEDLKNLPVFTYNFQEFNNPDKYAKAVEKIKQFAAYAKPPFKLNNVVFCNPSLHFLRIDSLYKTGKIRSDALKYYIDPTTFNVKEGNHVEVNTRLPYEYLYQPFYLLNTEVTNAEYREFIYYVRDSIARNLLAVSTLNVASEYGAPDDSTGRMILKWKKKIDYGSGDDLYREVLQPIYLPEGRKFYNRKEIDTRKINFEYYSRNGEIKYVINVYPDTLAWVNDLKLNEELCTMEPNANMYNWHPAYDHHPVTGLTHRQVKAFLVWKTQKLQKEIDKQKIPLIVEYDLPNEVELEMLILNKDLSKKAVLNFNRKTFLNHASCFNLDLVLNMNTKTHLELNENNDQSLIPELIRKVCNKYNLLHYSVFPTTSTLLPKKLNVNSLNYFNSVYANGAIPFINGNVSEWMSETLTKNDSLLYYRKEKDGKKSVVRFSSWNNPSFTFPFRGNFEDIYVLSKKMMGREKDPCFEKIKYNIIDSNLVKNENCYLVKGANWLDPGDLFSNDPKKNFVPEDSAFSTIGFRYVVRFKSK